MPDKTDVGWFDDSNDLSADLDTVDEERLAQLWDTMIRADFSGTRPGSVMAAARAAAAADKLRYARAIARAMESDDLITFIESSAQNRSGAEQLALALAPPDPSPAHNRLCVPAVAAFTDWSDYEHPLIIVPGYTPPSQATPLSLHDIGRQRLVQARQDYEDKLAPFILLTGANVYPTGTPYYEAIEMKSALLEMDVPEERIIVEARARHSTTNLRNAARFMRAHGMARAVITTLGGGIFGSQVFDQDFYFSHPGISTFDGRCKRELGYVVGELSSAGEHHTLFEPSAMVTRIGYRDPLDP